MEGIIHTGNQVRNMAGRKKDPLYKSFGYAFQGIFTCIRQERNMKIHCTCGDRRADPWNFRDGVVYLPGTVRNGDGAGTGKYGSGSCGRSCDRRTSPSGKDRQGHSSRSSTDRSDHGSDCRADHFCSERACFSGNMVREVNGCFGIRRAAGYIV